MKNTKSKVLIMSVCALLLVAASVFGTLAYLISQDEVVNTFTVGQVNITLDEAKVTPDGVPVEGADRVKGNEYHLIPGRTYVKDPTMKVVKGSEQSYVRMFVTINNLEALAAIYNNSTVEILSLFDGYDPTKWEIVDVTVNGDTATVEFRYFEPVDASEADEDVVLEPLFTSFTVPGEIDGDQLATISDLQITVVGNAMQTYGFENVDDAWAAFDEQINK